MIQLTLVSTGDRTDDLDRLETGMAGVLPQAWELDTLRLGRVQSLRVAYHNAARLIGDRDRVLILAHQDVCPATAETLAGLPAELAGTLQPLLGREGAAAPWTTMLERLLSMDDFGIAGVAGSRELDPGSAWWQHERLAGMVLHQRDEGVRVNAFGPFGRALVLDGLCLIARAGTLLDLSPGRDLAGRFHFYDMDLCLAAHRAGLRNWALPMLLLHGSGGASSEDPRWRQDLQAFLNRHRAALPASVPDEGLPPQR